MIPRRDLLGEANSRRSAVGHNMCRLPGPLEGSTVVSWTDRLARHNDILCGLATGVLENHRISSRGTK